MDTFGERDSVGKGSTGEVEAAGGAERAGGPGPTLCDPTLREPGEAGEPGGARAFGIYVSCWSDRWTVRISGRVDAAGAAAILDVAEVLAARRAPAVDLDLSEVTEIDPAGWRAVGYAESLLASAGGGCKLVLPASDLGFPSGSDERHSGHAA